MADLNDYEWLTGAAASAWFARLAGDATPVERLSVRLRRDLSMPRVHLLVEQRELRHRAQTKFTRASEMFFTRQSLEQATDERLAAWKAGQFPADLLVADLCAGIGGDALALAARGPVVAVERDPNVARLAAANADVLGASSMRVVVADVEQVVGLPGIASSVQPLGGWHLDPDRRAEGRRTTTWAACQPGPEAAARWRDASAVGVVKLAPATAVPEEVGREAQLDWVETRGECRQQLVWFGPLARHPGRRTATIVDRGSAPRIVVEQLGDEPEQINELRRFLAEPRPSVLAANLADSLAMELHAARLGPPTGYLTTDAAYDDAAWQLYEVLDALPFDRRKLKAALRQRGWGRVVLKCRGVKIDLEQLGRDLASPGLESGIVLFARFAERVWAVLARRDPKDLSGNNLPN